MDPSKNKEATVIETDVAPHSHVIRTDQGSEIRRNRRDMIELPQEEAQQASTPENIQSSQPHENDQSTQPQPRKSTRNSRPTKHFAPYIKPELKGRCGVRH